MAAVHPPHISTSELIPPTLESKDAAMSHLPSSMSNAMTDRVPFVEMASVTLDIDGERDKSIEKSSRSSGSSSRYSSMYSKWVDGKPMRHFILNLWVLAIGLGFIAIYIVAKPRTHEPEFGAGWQSVTPVQPYIQALSSDSATFVYVRVDLPPWEGQENGHDYSFGGVQKEHMLQGYRRRRALLNKMSPRVAFRTMFRSLRSAGSSHLPYIEVWLAQVDQLLVPSQNESNSTTQGFISETSFPLNATVAATGKSRCNFSEVTASVCVVEKKHVQGSIPGAPLLLIVALGGTVEGAAVLIQAVEMGTFGFAKEWAALAVIVLALLGIASEKIHRVWCAFAAAFAMCGLLLVGNLAPDLLMVMDWLDFGTLGLLWGMMVIVGVLQKTGVFEVICAWCLTASKGRMIVLTILLCTMTGFLSMWLDNVTTMLLMGPMAISVFATLGRDPVPLLISMAMMSNVGGTATMIGDPPNIIIGNVLRQEIGFIDFIIHLTPGVIVALPLGLACLIWMFKDSLAGKLDNFEVVLKKCEEYKIKDWKLLAISGYITLSVVIAFLLHPIHHLNPAWIAVIGAVTVGVLTSPNDVHEIMLSIEWDMLLFFAGMFIMVEAAVELGLIRKIAAFLTMVIQSAPPDKYNIVSVQVIIWFSAFFSAILDNIPYTITMLPVIQNLAENVVGLDLITMAWALSFGACFGGNGSLIGASANIVTSSIAAKAGFHLSFVAWLKPGIMVTIVTVAVADVYMILRYCL